MKTLPMLALLFVANTTALDATTDCEQVKIAIANYHGHCPCPWSLAKDGSYCGKRSAYSRSGGREPACYCATAKTPG